MYSLLNQFILILFGLLLFVNLFSFTMFMCKSLGFTCKRTWFFEFWIENIEFLFFGSTLSSDRGCESFVLSVLREKNARNFVWFFVTLLFCNKFLNVIILKVILFNCQNRKIIFNSSIHATHNDDLSIFGQVKFW